MKSSRNAMNRRANRSRKAVQLICCAFVLLSFSQNAMAWQTKGGGTKPNAASTAAIQARIDDAAEVKRQMQARIERSEYASAISLGQANIGKSAIHRGVLTDLLVEALINQSRFQEAIDLLANGLPAAARTGLRRQTLTWLYAITGDFARSYQGRPDRAVWRRYAESDLPPSLVPIPNSIEESRFMSALAVGLELHDLSRFKDAEAWYQKALSIRPHDCYANYLLGMSARMTDRNRARVYFAKSAETAPPQLMKRIKNFTRDW